jgi:hypothetical protein
LADQLAHENKVGQNVIDQDNSHVSILTYGDALIDT